MHCFDGQHVSLVLTARTIKNYSLLFRCEVNLKNMTAKANKSFVKLGQKDSFDERGMSYPCISNFKNTQYLFYTGWANSEKNPFLNSLGYGKFDNEFKKLGPVWIHSDQGSIKEVGSIEIIEFNNIHYMFFTQFNDWNHNSPSYNIRVAKSNKIDSWVVDKSFNFNEIDNIASMICRPSIIQYQSKHLMFFCYRENDTDYKIGLASSDNFFDWNLCSKDIFNKILLEDWCKEGQAYPHIYHDLKTKNFYLFFAGNSYGRDGFGVLQLNLDTFVQ